jgi:hypothetical protein
MYLPKMVNGWMAPMVSIYRPVAPFRRRATANRVFAGISRPTSGTGAAADMHLPDPTSRGAVQCVGKEVDLGNTEKARRPETGRAQFGALRYCRIHHSLHHKGRYP